MQTSHSSPRRVPALAVGLTSLLLTSQCHSPEGTVSGTGAPAQSSGFETVVEDVAQISSYSGNTDPFWGYHQPILVRTSEAVYAALLEPLGEGSRQRWVLYQRTDRWRRVFTSAGDAPLNQPPLLATADGGKLYAFFWPGGIFAELGFGEDLTRPLERRPPVSLNDTTIPYAGLGVNSQGDIFLVTSLNPEHRSDIRSAATGSWIRTLTIPFARRPESPNGYDRHAYPFVALRDSEAHVFSTQDIADPEKIAQGSSFPFSFRTLEYYYSPDVHSQPFRTVTVASVEDTKGWVHNDDMLLDRAGQIHLLYRLRTRDGDPSTTSALMHAFGPAGGVLRHVPLGMPGDFSESRLWESPRGILYVIGSPSAGGALRVAPIGAEGGLAAEPTSVMAASGRIFVACGRASTTGAPVLEGLHAISATGLVRYFQVSGAALR